MSRLATIFQQRAAPGLLAHLGEGVIYTPAGAAAKAIAAVVHRDPLEVPGVEGAIAMYPVQLLISKEDIAVVTVNADTVALKRRVSDTRNTILRVGRIIDQSGGCWTLGLVG